MKKWSVRFDTSKEDTCMNEWKAHMSENSSGKIIDSVEIETSKRGCKGHPKTIMTLMQNIPFPKLNVYMKNLVV